MMVYRITKRKHSRDLSGTGAALYPGRWNKKGTPVLYAGANPEIALLENLVHLPSSICPELDIVSISIPDEQIKEYKINDLPDNWYHHPAPTILSEIGQEWVDEGKTLAMKVPSAVIHTSTNVILNCAHPEFENIKIVDIVPFYMDNRLVR